MAVAILTGRAAADVSARVRVGGLLYLGGMLLMAWNVAMTARAGRVTPAAIPAPGLSPAALAT